MTSTELERLIRERLEKEGLSLVLDEHRTQFLDFPDGLFAELVLRDGSKVSEVNRISREVRETLQEQGVEVEVRVSVNWALSDVRYIGATRGLRDAEAFAAKLVSGPMEASVEIDVTTAAKEEIAKIVKQTKGSVSASALDLEGEVVKEFLKFRLSLGGANYWDPLQYPQIDLTPADAAYVLGYAPFADGQTGSRV